MSSPLWRAVIVATALALLTVGCGAAPDVKKKTSEPMCLKSDASKMMLKRKCQQQDALNYCNTLSQTCGTAWGNSSWATGGGGGGAANCTELTTPVASGGCGLATQQALDTLDSNLTAEVQQLQVQVDSQAAQLQQLQAQVDSLIGQGNASKPFDSATCLATNISSYKTDPSPNGARWVAVDFFPGGSNDVCERSAALTSCSNACARVGLMCDPCALAKVSCQDALYYALTEAREDVGLVALLSLLPPGPPGPWNQTTCAAPGVPQEGAFAPDDRGSDKPYAKQFGWAMQVCDASGPPIVTDFYTFNKNYWRPDLPDSYIDPSTLCNLPLVTRDNLGLTMFSGLCYCS